MEDCEIELGGYTSFSTIYLLPSLHPENTSEPKRTDIFCLCGPRSEAEIYYCKIQKHEQTPKDSMNVLSFQNKVT